MKKAFLVTLIWGIMFTLTLPVFAATNVTISTHNIFFYVTQGKIGFQETLYYNNPQGEEIKVTVPKDAENITQASAGGTVALKKSDLKETTDGLEATVKVPKGSDTIEMRYFITPKDGGADYATKINYDTEKIQLLSTGDVVPQGHQLGQLPREKAANGFYVVPVNPLKPGEVLQVRLFADPAALDPASAPKAPQGAKNTPEQNNTNTTAAAKSTVMPAVLIVIFIALLIAAVFYFIKMRKQG